MPRQAAERALRTLCDRDSRGKWGKDNTEEGSGKPEHWRKTLSLPCPHIHSSVFLYPLLTFSLAFQKAIQRAMLFVLHELGDGNLTERFAILCRVAGGFSLLNG